MYDDIKLRSKQFTFWQDLVESGGGLQVHQSPFFSPGRSFFSLVCFSTDATLTAGTEQATNAVLFCVKASRLLRNNLAQLSGVPIWSLPQLPARSLHKWPSPCIVIGCAVECFSQVCQEVENPSSTWPHNDNEEGAGHHCSENIMERQHSRSQGLSLFERLKESPWIYTWGPE